MLRLEACEEDVVISQLQVRTLGRGRVIRLTLSVKRQFSKASRPYLGEDHEGKDEERRLTSISADRPQRFRLCMMSVTFKL